MSEIKKKTTTTTTTTEKWVIARHTSLPTTHGLKITENMHTTNIFGQYYPIISFNIHFQIYLFLNLIKISSCHVWWEEEIHT